ncbi:1,4-alpha-glucan branching protein [Nocardia puris]|uniref:maltokinase N-terminal cap-like domain-containing protein n=1 Tax=Nocardia puris TaxID=208602 RepID=UPI00189394E7|nr:1,4-alpha-glucan branching protein [Nocardia puris]MBF6210522.1 1,4-alpha-glucan branching protein [Nocardia puris]MBF6369247.1 1,4-alpha-glucan branching protein [Nocardia puris]MBF6457782.1 1,4-alpha-glucan branching protein [Nocardia puris]
MAVIHRTTMTPSKPELLARWLPARPWFRGGATPVLARAGGFRLDDPAGEVGIEFVFVTDTSSGEPVTYNLPMAYRGVPRDGGADSLIGTSEHGVLGTRWIYDGTRDPVVVAVLADLLAGRAVPQAQNESDAPDPTVTVTDPLPIPAPTEFTVTDDAASTVITTPHASLTLPRVLRASEPSGTVVHAPWRTGEMTTERGVVLVAHAAG